MSKPNSPPARQWAFDGREVDLLHYIYSRPDIKQLRGNPQKVLAAIDDYCQKFNPLINVGPTKGPFVTNLIAERKPSVMIELGGYIGYSAILFGAAVRANGGQRFLSIENNPEMAAVANQLVELAGLRDTVQILVGSSSDWLVEIISEQKDIQSVEMLFLDHWQDLYLPDLWLLEQLDVLVPGTSVLLADNVIMPGAPKYLEWVKATPSHKKKLVEKLGAGSLVPKPELVYDTTVHEFEAEFGKDLTGLE
ncbi:hypothetical protein N7474_004340 [Penicillium riverlandense]|uniref:uncharacterized protein n=1 Tax=Penicillium riverlandense TaxID=1903569 RepID=UPI0025482B25|nr:uncharacterized protein N7474_004340 [Penicillium riverlandense]KAJ5818749.1 hypothetical protein N7474_004340 [Penicillium riverlandense]